jgi:hypothetical protein
MRLLLVGRSELLVEAWRHCLAGISGVEVIHGDICRVECDAIVSPANSFGFMDGGLDLALSLRFGWDLQERLQTLKCDPPVRTLAVPGLGTGVGRVDPLTAAHQMHAAYREIVLGQEYPPTSLLDAALKEQQLLLAADLDGIHGIDQAPPNPGTSCE